jgi:hypothetical protein
MRLPLAVAAALALTATAAHAADTLTCRGDLLVMPDKAASPMDVTLTVEGGMEAPSTVTYAWARPESPVAMDLKGLSGDTLQFHGIAPAKDGAVTVADAQLNRATLALVLKVRRLGEAGEELTLETTCQRG